MDFGKAPAVGTIALILVTALISATCALLINRTGDSLLRQLTRPIMYIGDKLWGWIAPRNPFSIALHSYRKHILRSSLSRIENPVGPVAQISMENAFAPLRLLSANRAEPIDLFDYMRTEWRMIVLGGPGTGKTTLMKHLMLSVVRRRADPVLNERIPVFVILRDLASKRHSVIDAIIEAFGAYHFPGAGKFVNSALDQGKLIIIFDGLDEVGANRAFVVEQIQKFCDFDDQRTTKNHVVVTCRENSYRTQDLRSAIGNIVRVEPFTNHHARLFLKGWPEYRGRIAIGLYAELQSVPEIREACRSPLLLSILAGLYLETEIFELPRSRDKFYLATLDELLVQRPARRQITQTFSREEKMRLLQLVALERLESASETDDTEALLHEAILQYAKEVIQRDFDGNQLITELVEVNGIIKPTEESRYTFPHRTIQEYLAAREARRTRDVELVLYRFGQRPDLFESLLFYCGVIDNIPVMERIITHFADEKEWRRAGECLLNMTEPLAQDTVTAVAGALYAQISKAEMIGVSDMRTIEILSYLGQRQHSAFEKARAFFEKTVELLTHRPERGASALEAALASDPELAIKLIPSLLEHPSSEWQQTAVRLLRDVGTDEALDQLVLILREQDSPARTEAAIVIAEMLKTRGDEVRQRQTLLPVSENVLLWPLEAWVSGSLALPIIEAVSSAGKQTGNRAIDAGVMAVLLEGDATRASRKLLKQWRRLRRDCDLAQRLSQASLVCERLAMGLAVGVFFCVLSLLIWARATERVLICQPPVAIRWVGAEPFRELNRDATRLITQIREGYPPNSSWGARLLSWMWDVNPILPHDAEASFNKCVRLSSGIYDPSNIAIYDTDLRLIEALKVDPRLVVRLENDIGNIRLMTAKIKTPYVLIRGPGNANERSWMLIVFLQPIFCAFIFRMFMVMQRRRSFAEDRHMLMLKMILNSRLFAVVALFLIAMSPMEFAHCVPSQWRWLPIGIVGLLYGFGVFNARFDLPRNPFRTVVEDLPSRVDG